MSTGDLGEQLKKYKKEKGYSMAEIQAITGISADKLYKWTKGTKPSEAEDVLKLRDLFSGKLEQLSKDTPVKPLQPQQASPPDNTERLIQILDRQNLTLTRLLETNLESLLSTQRIILAEVKAGLRWEAKKIAGKNQKKEEEILMELNRIVAEYLMLPEQKDSRVEDR